MKIRTIKAGDPEAVTKYEALIEAYKIQNPVKYALKKAELEAKLEALKANKKE